MHWRLPGERCSVFAGQPQFTNTIDFNGCCVMRLRTLNSSLRITLTSVVVLTTMMVLQMPFAAYGLYVIFMVGHVNTAVTLRTGIALLCSVACALSIA